MTPKNSPDVPAAAPVSVAPDPNPMVDFVNTLAEAIRQNAVNRPTRLQYVPPPGVEVFDTTGWAEFMPAVTINPVYIATRKDTGKLDYYHVSLRPGVPVLLPKDDALTLKFIEVGQLETPAGWPSRREIGRMRAEAGG